MIVNHLQKLFYRRSGIFLVKRSLSVGQCFLQANKSYAPNNLEKRFLVWTGKYKNIEAVPKFVSDEEMERCRNRVRIRLANIMMVLTVVGCIVMVISGKKAVERGETVTKENLAWHQRYNEMHGQKPAEKSS